MSGPYKTVLADPPWSERGGGVIKRGADRHYPLMREDDIVNYLRANIPVGKDAFLFLWATNNHLEEALSVARRFGFRYVTNLVWVKDRVGLGQYLRGQHELLLLCIRGSPGYKEQASEGRAVCTVPSVLHAKRREHSRKPDEVYGICEAIGRPPFIEAFARHARAGWDAVGNEVDWTREED